MFTNSINGKRYIGSSENLNRRFKEYFNINYLLKNNSMYICNSLIKHGYSNFSLIILEYCEPSKCLIREKHYWDLFNPEYNLAKDPTAPFSGRKHSDKTKTKMSDALTGENHPMFGKTGENHPNYGKTHSDETKTIMSEAKKGKPRAEGAGKPFQKVEVFDKKTNKTTTYNSISEAARALNLSNHKIITNYILRNQKKPYKGIYTFKKV
jgi:group I intron endonuclease